MQHAAATYQLIGGTISPIVIYDMQMDAGVFIGRRTDWAGQQCNENGTARPDNKTNNNLAG